MSTSANSTEKDTVRKITMKEFEIVVRRWLYEQHRKTSPIDIMDSSNAVNLPEAGIRKV